MHIIVATVSVVCLMPRISLFYFAYSSTDTLVTSFVHLNPKMFYNKIGSHIYYSVDHDVEVEAEAPEDEEFGEVVDDGSEEEPVEAAADDGGADQADPSTLLARSLTCLAYLDCLVSLAHTNVNNNCKVYIALSVLKALVQ